MATEEEKKRNLVKLSSLVIHGLTRGLWELLGESAEVTAKLIGHTNVEMLEKEMGFEVAGEDLQDMMTELDRVFVDELGALDQCETVVEDNQITMTCTGCKFMSLTRDLMQEGIPPFICPFKGMAIASVSKRIDSDARHIDSDVNTETHVCVHKFETL